MSHPFVFPDGTEISYPRWAMYISVDGDGDVIAWGKKPRWNEVHSQWYVRFTSRQVLHKFGKAVSNAGWMLFQVSEAQHEKKKKSC